MKEENDNNVLNAFALVGFVLGLLSILLYWALAIVPILAIIFSIIGIVRTKKTKQKGKSIAITGLVLGIVFTCLFGGKIFLAYNNYFQNIISSNNLHKEQIDYQKYIKGTWKYEERGDGFVSLQRYVITDNSVSYTCTMYNSNEKKTTIYFEIYGTPIFSDNKVTVHYTNYKEGSDMVLVKYFIGTTETLKYKNNVLYKQNDIKLIRTQ